jgi:ABC-type sugar transport system substrate-binding protein
LSPQSRLIRATIAAMAGSIRLFLRTTENDYQVQLKEEALRQGKRAGFTVEVESAQDDAGRQVAQITAALEKAHAGNLVAVLVAPVRDDNLPATVRAAAEAGVEWVLLNREASFIEELRQQFTGRAIFAVTPEQAEIGRIHGQQVRALMPAGGCVLCVTGPLGASSAQHRLDGLKSAMVEPYRLVTLNADWTSEGARLALERWLKDMSKDAEVPGVFVAQNDEMALGLRQAARDAAVRMNLPLDKTPIVGCDGTPTLGQRLVREGRLRGTVVTPPASGPAVEWIARMRGQGEIPPAVVVQELTSFPALSNLRK